MSQCDTDSKSNHVSEKKLDKRYRRKEFIVQDSLYTTLLKNDQIKSVYHIFVVIFIFMLLDSISHDLLTSGRIYFGLRTIRQSFGKIHLGLAVWSLVHIQVVGLYYALQIWAQVMRNLKQNGAFQAFWNFFCIICFIGFQINLFYIGVMACVRYNFPFATSTAMLMETFRLMMKMYAFVRTNIPHLLTDKSFQLDPISSYIYYLFAPTFIYRNSYPRTKNIRWTFAFFHLFEVICIMFLKSIIYERYILTNFQNFGLEKLTATELIDKVLVMILPGSLIFLSIGYLILHSWLNFTGEVLRFGDRMYYKDWWTSSSYDAYYRNWNVVVHDWFYEYVFKDTHNYIFKGSKICSSLVVFYLSALMHELVLGFVLQMYYPVMFIFFAVFGVLFFFTTHKLPETIGKVFFWFTFLLGGTFLVCLYAMEYFARKNSIPVNSFSWIPVSLTYKVLTEV